MKRFLHNIPHSIIKQQWWVYINLINGRLLERGILAFSTVNLLLGVFQFAVLLLASAVLPLVANVD